MAAESKEKKESTKKKKRFLALKITGIAVLAVLVISMIMMGSWYKNIIKKAPAIDQIDATPTGYLSTVLDSEENKIATLVASGSNRVYMTLDEIPKELQQAFVAVEDARFYSHNGVDYKGIVRAFIKGIKNGGNFSEGASTITQQLLKNNVFVSWMEEATFMDRLERKIQEQYLATQLEKKESKEWILENYLNTINLGQNTLGVQAAANRYFNKDVSELNLSECAVIAGITKNPTAYNPIDHPKKNEERRKIVLDDMIAQGYITQKQYQEAMDDDVYERIKTVNEEKEDQKEINSYFIDALTEQVVEDLMEKKAYSKTEAYKALYNGGLTIYSTQDSRMQKICEEEINREENYEAEVQYSFSYQLTVLKANGKYENYNEQTLLKYYREQDENYRLLYYSKEEAMEAIDTYRQSVVEEGDTVSEGNEKIHFSLQPETSLTLMDQKTGEVLAIVGGRGDKEASRTLNRATDSMRQPGSTFKILSTFAPALDTAGKTLATVEDDAPYLYSDGKTSVNNYDGRFRGLTTYREAIRDSINIVTVKAVTDIGTQIGFDYLLKFGFTTLTEDDNRQTMSLGGIKNGVTNLELTAAYAAIANDGTYIAPRFYTKILDHEGNVMIDHTVQKKDVIKKTTASLLTNAMQDVMTEGSGTAANVEWMTLAGKSGTTTKCRDLWFVGYSPYYTCAVWGGFDQNYAQESGDTVYVKKIWKSVMSRIHEGYEDTGFEMADGIVSYKICQKSGLLARNGYCDEDPRGSMVREEFFEEGTEPTEYCNCHVKAKICQVSGMPANQYCKQTEEKVFLLNPAEGTEDFEYGISSEQLETECNIHKAPKLFSDWFNKTEKKDKDDKEKNDLTASDLDEETSGDEDDTQKTEEDPDETDETDETVPGDEDSTEDVQETFQPDTDVKEEDESFLEKLDVFHWFH